MSKRRVVVTGIGVTTPIGHDVPSSVAALKEGRGGIRRMPEWDIITDLHGRLGATVEGLDLLKIYPRKQRRTMGKVALLAVHSAEQAVKQSGLGEEHLVSERTGVAFGSTSGSGSEQEAFSTPIVLHHSMRGLESNAYFRLMTHTCAVNVAQFFKVKGRIASTCTACTSASQGIGTGYELIAHGIQDVMLVGGAEEMHYMNAVTFDLLMATSHKYNDTPELTPRPFDAARDGLVVGEGAGALVLESYEHAKARGAEILCELYGYASNCDGAHLTSPREEGMQRVMELALKDAGVSATDVDYVCAHGTGTEIGDIAESNATRALFDRDVPLSSLKGYVGHTLGACGAIEAAWCIAMMRGGFLVANRNLVDVDPRCAPLDYVKELREARPRVVMNNNFAFGGINTSMILGDVR
ncbi:MAG: beta-ketoacyl-ACP synthase [Sandaracinus sp.]|nr:beta-ketoacyl-ACP synthase [Sandaracinus sp.]MCB9611596.1 beta-ketoacyl-ACP synthase [Sandaracinus sp.]